MKTRQHDYSPEAQTRSAAAFNAGSDARLAGQPISANPFSRHHEGREYQAWRSGWQNVNCGFGADARWPVRDVPAVQQTA